MRDRSLAVIIVACLVMWGFLLPYLNLANYGIDTRAYADAALRFAAGQSPYLDPTIAHSLIGAETYRYPPTFAIVMAPLVTLLGRDSFTHVWAIASVVSIAASLALAWRAAGGRLGRNAILSLAAIALFSLPLAEELSDGNMGAFLALGVGLMLFWGPGGRSGVVGLVAAVVKVAPITMLPAVLVAGGRRAAIALTISGLLLVGLPMLLWPEWWAQSLQVLLATNSGDVSLPQNLAPAAILVTLAPDQSLLGVLARAASIGIALGLVGLSAWRARRPAGWASAIGLSVVASLMVSPQLWAHYLVVLLPLWAYALVRSSGRTLGLTWGSILCINVGIMFATVPPFGLLASLGLAMVVTLAWSASPGSARESGRSQRLPLGPLPPRTPDLDQHTA